MSLVLVETNPGGEGDGKEPCQWVGRGRRLGPILQYMMFSIRARVLLLEEYSPALSPLTDHPPSFRKQPYPPMFDVCGLQDIAVRSHSGDGQTLMIALDQIAVSEPARLNHLQALEAESIAILREAVAEFARPVMLYSIGKDSSVMLRLAQKAFYPGRFRFRCCMWIRATSFPR